MADVVVARARGRRVPAPGDVLPGSAGGRPSVRPLKETDALSPPEAAKYNKFRNVIVAHQRAQQLKNGARPRIETGTHKFLWVAMREVSEGLISWDSPEARPPVTPA